MTKEEVSVVVGGAFFVLVLAGAISQTFRQERLAKRKGRLYAMTPGAALPSKRSLLIGLGLAATWAVVSTIIVLV